MTFFSKVTGVNHKIKFPAPISMLLLFMFSSSLMICDVCLKGLQYILDLCHPENCLYSPIFSAGSVLLYFHPLLPEDGAIQVEMLERFVLLLAEPTERGIVWDYYTVHVVQIIVSCDCVYKKCHVFSTQPSNYLPYPTVRSLIEYSGHSAFFFPFVVDILPGSCLNFFVCCLCFYLC